MRTFTNEEAFKKVPGEQKIGLEPHPHAHFTRKWFLQRNCATWSTFLLPKFGDGRPIRMVQIGVFEGMDLMWCCQHLLKHPNSRAVAIDPWAATTKLDTQVMEDVCSRAYRNLAPWQRKVTIHRGYSADVLPTLEAEAFDLVIIDGDHNALPVLDDAVKSLRLTKKGGWLVFDDVRNRIPKKDHVLQGLEMFLHSYEDKVEFKWAHRYADCYERVK